MARINATPTTGNQLARGLRRMDQRDTSQRKNGEGNDGQHDQAGQSSLALKKSPKLATSRATPPPPISEQYSEDKAKAAAMPAPPAAWHGEREAPAGIASNRENSKPRTSAAYSTTSLRSSTAGPALIDLPAQHCPSAACGSTGWLGAQRRSCAHVVVVCRVHRGPGGSSLL